jgi:hypothetical protein
MSSCASLLSSTKRIVGRLAASAIVVQPAPETVSPDRVNECRNKDLRLRLLLPLGRRFQRPSGERHHALLGGGRLGLPL